MKLSNSLAETINKEDKNDSELDAQALKRFLLSGPKTDMLLNNEATIYNQ